MPSDAVIRPQRPTDAEAIVDVHLRSWRWACGLVPYSVNVHYPSDDLSRGEREERFLTYRSFRNHPVLALEDDALISVRGTSIRLVEGTAWRFTDEGREAYARQSS